MWCKLQAHELENYAASHSLTRGHAYQPSTVELSCYVREILHCPRDGVRRQMSYSSRHDFHLTSSTRALFPYNYLIILELLCFMLLWTDYSGNYADILDASLVLPLSTSTVDSGVYQYDVSAISYDVHCISWVRFTAWSHWLTLLSTNIVGHVCEHD